MKLSSPQRHQQPDAAPDSISSISSQSLYRPDHVRQDGTTTVSTISSSTCGPTPDVNSGFQIDGEASGPHTFTFDLENQTIVTPSAGGLDLVRTTAAPRPTRYSQSRATEPRWVWWSNQQLESPGRTNEMHDAEVTQPHATNMRAVIISARAVVTQSGNDVSIAVPHELEVAKHFEGPHLPKLLHLQRSRDNSEVYEAVFDVHLRHTIDQQLKTVRGGRLQMVTARNSIRSVLLALSQLHAKGLSHNHICLQNALVDDRDGRVVLLGCKDDANFPMCGSTCDLAAHELAEHLQRLPPEAATAKADGKPTDIWAVGAAVLEMLGSSTWVAAASSRVGGTLTTSGGSLSAFELIGMIQNSENALPNGIPVGTPPVLMEFFEKCFDRDPTKRATATDLLESEWMTCPDSELEDLPNDEPSSPTEKMSPTRTQREMTAMIDALLDL